MHIINYDTPPPIEELRLSKLAAEKENGRWTWEKKYQAVLYWMTTGNLRETSKKSGIPTATLEQWKKLSWWDDMEEQIKTSNRMQLDNKLTQLINKSLEKIGDMLENGEVVLNNKTGELIQKPIGMRDATKAAESLMARQIALNKSVEEKVFKEKSIQDTLATLAVEFAKWSKKQSKETAETIEYTEVKDDLESQRTDVLSSDVHPHEPNSDV